MKLIAQLIVILSLLISPFYSQNLQWQAIYNGPADGLDLAQKILVDAVGNVFVTGSSMGTGTGSDFATIKYSPAGVQQWVARYNGPTNKDDQAFAAAADDNGNVYVCGNSYNNTVQDICLVKYNSSGTVVWTARYPSAFVYHQFPGQFVMASDNAGNCIITGKQSDNLVVIKYNSSGVQQWVATYNGPSNGEDIGKTVLLDASGNVFIAGTSFGTGTADDIVLIKYNSSGVQQWAVRYNNAAYNKRDEITALKMDKLGNLYVSGFSYNNNQLSQPVLLTCKFSSGGQLLWSQTISSQYTFAMGNDLAIDDFNNIYITGSIVYAGSKESMIIAKYNQSGIQQWVKYYNRNSSSDDCGYGIAIDKHNYIYVQSHSKTSGSNNYRVIAKFNSNGNQIWTLPYQLNITGTGSENNSSMVMVDKNFNIYSTGGNLGNAQTEDYVTLKYNSSCFTVSGTVVYKDNNQPISSGIIKVLYYDRSSAQIVTLDSSVIQSNGTYTLNCNHPDSVYFMVYQDDEVLDYVPTYYPSAIDWQLAERVYTNQNLTNINIQVYRINNTSSPYSINGAVMNNFQGTNYINGAIVYAKIGNEFKNFSISQNNGSYLVKKLPAGNYTLTAYRLGYNSVTQSVSISNSNLTGINFNFTNPIGITKNNKILPGEYTLMQNYPNPFNPSTKIAFTLPVKEFVKLTVYDITGREKAELINSEMEAGNHEITFDALQLSSGVYFYKLTTKNIQLTKKMVLIK